MEVKNCELEFESRNSKIFCQKRNGINEAYHSMYMKVSIMKLPLIIMISPQLKSLNYKLTLFIIVCKIVLVVDVWLHLQLYKFLCGENVVKVDRLRQFEELKQKIFNKKLETLNFRIVFSRNFHCLSRIMNYVFHLMYMPIEQFSSGAKKLQAKNIIK